MLMYSLRGATARKGTVGMRDPSRRVLQAPDAAWLMIFATIAGAWIGLAWLSLRDVPPPPSQALGWFDGTLEGTLWRSLCAADMASAGWPLVLAMWMLMVLAMMLPSAVPMIRTFMDLTAGRPGGSLAKGLGQFIAGYLAVWGGFALLAAGLQWQLAALDLVAADGLSASWALTAALLSLAGAYQFSGLKAACLTQCRGPMTFFLQHWKSGALGALRMGLRHGATCVGCCWALMLLAFVGGAMNLAWMSLAMGLMILEKLPQAGRLVSKPLGIFLITGGICVTISNLGWT